MSKSVSRRRELLHTTDADIDVIIEGAGSPIVLLPSSLRDSEDFDHFAQLIAGQGYQVLRPQPRGMGRSSPPPAGMTLETLADDIAAVIEAFAEGPAVIVGHAYGHWIARITDLRHPQLVRAVVLLGAAARSFPPGMAEALAVASDPTHTDSDRLAALQLCMFAPGNDPKPWLQGWHPEWRSAYREAAKHPPKDEWFGRANAPILDLQGACDPWRPPSSRGELASAAGERVTVQAIDNASHALVPEQPQAVAAAIVAWIYSLKQPAG